MPKSDTSGGAKRLLFQVPEEYADGRTCEADARKNEYKDFAGVHYMFKPEEQSEYEYIRLKSNHDAVSADIYVTATGEYLTERYYKKGRGIRTDDEKDINDKEKSWKWTDNSFGVYSTYYMLALYWTVWLCFEVLWTVLAFLFGTKLWSRLPLLIWVGAMAAAAGYSAHFHHRCSDHEDDCHDTAYSSVFTFQALAGAMIVIGAASIFLNVLPQRINRKL